MGYLFGPWVRRVRNGLRLPVDRVYEIGGITVGLDRTGRRGRLRPTNV
ncbi:Uncharacterised protein [Mycobacterium tuberculosis]|uniref:Uncharacterized protein n=1 Tax=Mycobacterium tuberculosis TaxID=1773 RepID=A0A0U0SRC7_MYCTX|nr:Uncharacterised protein [Mycobacterium tuberculosis]COW92691.1 Uncharacterised protein [Mycobacterium tuberculosis]COX04102.1 Uncharacterised protein [Mycobacterium tuberculosis]